MIKMIFCVKRRPAMEPEKFYRYWIEHHGPLVRRHAQALKIKKYIQCHTCIDPEAARLGEEARKERNIVNHFDGTAELWWDSVEALTEALDCVFRGKVDTDSGLNWTPIPGESGRAFRAKLDTHSGVIWTPIPG